MGFMAEISSGKPFTKRFTKGLERILPAGCQPALSPSAIGSCSPARMTPGWATCGEGVLGMVEGTQRAKLMEGGGEGGSVLGIFLSVGGLSGRAPEVAVNEAQHLQCSQGSNIRLDLFDIYGWEERLWGCLVLLSGHQWHSEWVHHTAVPGEAQMGP